MHFQKQRQITCESNLAVRETQLTLLSEVYLSKDLNEGFLNFDMIEYPKTLTYRFKNVGNIYIQNIALSPQNPKRQLQR